VYDEYLFTYIEQLLQKKGGKPKFIFLLSTTNHTPFEKPKHFKPRPIVMNDTMKKLTSNHPQAMDNFSNYQYSANCLGNFMDFVKKGDAKDKTIVAATGDHNNWMLFQYDDMVIHQKYGVPFYLYAPKDYLAGKTIDLQRFGSHKDIFPTLFHLSLSEQKYFNTGYDLLSNDTSLPFFGANENKVTISASGAVLDVQSKKTKFLKWNPEQNKKLMPASLQDQKLLDLYRRSRARTFLLHYYFNEILTGK
jgi:phosphoglycerol transferase MdoB-like AlkP superfamily enzyme